MTAVMDARFDVCTRVSFALCGSEAKERIWGVGWGVQSVWPMKRRRVEDEEKAGVGV